MASDNQRNLSAKFHDDRYTWRDMGVARGLLLSLVGKMFD
jgi:hypothetical protein